MRFFLSALLAMLLFQACSLDENTVAVVGDFKISKDEFKTQLAKQYGKKESYKSISLDDKKKLLDQLILRKQKLNEAFDKGYDNDQKIQEELAVRKRQMLTSLYYEKNIIDVLAPDSQVKSEFEKTKYEINASHVLISFNEINPSIKRSKEEAYMLAQTISNKIRSGADINEMAMEYSDDQTKDKNKGNLGYFVWGKMVNEFQQAAYKLEENEVSDPVLTNFGYHVIVVHDKRENARYNPDGFEKAKENIKKRIYYQYRSNAKPMWDEHLKNLKEQYNYKLLTENITKFVEKNIAMENPDSLSAEYVKKQVEAIILAEWDGGHCTSKDLVNNYLSRYNNNKTMIQKSLIKNEKVSRDVDQLSDFLLVAQVSEEQGYLEQEEMRKQLDDFLEYSLVTFVDKRIVVDPIEISEHEMKKYFAENQSEFILPDKMEMWEIYVTSQQKANKVYGYAKAGRDFEQLARNYSEDKSRAKQGGSLGLMAFTSRGSISRKAFEAGPNQILEPIKSRKGWVIIKTGDKKEKMIRSFENAMQIIKNKLRSNKIAEKRKAWEAHLSEAYPAKINDDLLPKI